MRLGPLSRHRAAPGPWRVIDCASLAITTLAAAALWLQLYAAAQPPAPAKSSPPPGQAALFVKGVVLGPEGEPLAKAQVTLTFVANAPSRRPIFSPIDATTDERGRIDVPLPSKNAARWSTGMAICVVGAWRPGLTYERKVITPSIVDTDADSKSKPAPFEIKLAREYPIEGRLLSLEGRGIAGARVGVVNVERKTEAEISAGVKRIARDRCLAIDRFASLDDSPRIDLVPRPLVSQVGPDGRFVLHGIPPDAIAQLVIEAEGICIPRQLAVLARSIDSFKMTPAKEDESYTSVVQCAGFVLFCEPSRTIAGVVHDALTNRPVAGVKVTHQVAIGFSQETLEATSNELGKYELKGCPLNKEGLVQFTPKSDSGYRATRLIAPADARIVGGTLDAFLKQGVWIDGRVIDKVSGKPISAVTISVRQDPSNTEKIRDPFDFLLFEEEDPVLTDDKGEFRILGYRPLAWLTAVDQKAPDLYRRRLGDKAIAAADGKAGADGLGFDPNDYHAVVKVVANPDQESISVELALDRGASREIRVVDSTGRPQTGFRILIRHSPIDPGRILSATADRFTITRLDPKFPSAIVIVAKDESHAGVFSIRGDEPEPIELRLEPVAAIVGRIVDQHGKPAGKLWVEAHPRIPGFDREFDDKGDALKRLVVLDATGRFNFRGVPVGLEWRLNVRRGFSDTGKDIDLEPTTPGKPLELGDIKFATP